MYRADIDGLRALAVLVVLFYHAGFNFVPGGFVGVDVFFVISGYLITNIIYQEQVRGTFTYQSFYSRRFKRILPAYFVVGLATLLAGYFILFPADYANLATSFISSIFFVSNMYFWKNTGGYFDSSADELPLLHTWSLAVEEQFYVFWPITLLLLIRFLPKSLHIFAIVLAIVASFLLSEWALTTHREAAYYFLPTRAGELLLGALIVFLPGLGRWQKHKPMLEVLSLVALFMILASAILLTSGSDFPGFNSFWPCFGCALLIFIGRDYQSIAHRLLSLRLFVGIGLISYSLYLWHWPIVAYTNYYGIEKDHQVGAAIVVASIALAYLSWKFIETPVRKSQVSFTKVFALIFVLPSILCIALAGLNVYTKGHESRMVVTGWKDRTGSVSPVECQKLHLDAYPDSCKLGDPNVEPSFAVWGDSFADSFVPTISEHASQRKISGYSFIMHSCPSIFEVVRNEPIRKGPKFQKMCDDYASQAYQDILNEESIKTVVLHSAYEWYSSALNKRNEPIALVKNTDRGGDEVIEKMVDMITTFEQAGKRVIVVMPHYAPKSFKTDVQKYNFLNQKHALDYNIASITPPHARLSGLLDKFGLGENVQRLYIHELVCKGTEICRLVSPEGQLLLSDPNHLSKVGVKDVVPVLLDEL